jgi:hypothetical protein
MRYYRSYTYQGKDAEASCEADNEQDAESEFDYFEQDLLRGDSMAAFEWTSSIYNFKTKVEGDFSLSPSSPKAQKP